jgi:hypothetical protein
MNFMLERISLVAALSGENLEVLATRDCPHGGGLSTVLRSLAMNELLGGGLIVNGNCAVGYADDMAITIKRKSPSTVSESL